MKKLLGRIGGAVFLLVSGVAAAHPGADLHEGLVHPLFGADHGLMALAIGLVVAGLIGLGLGAVMARAGARLALKLGGGAMALTGLGLLVAS